MGCNACNSVYRVPLLSLLEALLKWLQKGGKGCGMWIVQSYSLAICRPLRQARQALHQAREALTTCQVPHRCREEAQRAHAEVEACEAEVERWESVHSAYRHHLETVSLLVHPWRLCTSTP